MTDNKTSPDNVARQVLKPSIGVLLPLLGMVVWAFLEGSAVAVETCSDVGAVCNASRFHGVGLSVSP